MAPSLVTIPLELRFMIMDYVLGTNQKALHIDPNYLYQHFRGWDALRSPVLRGWTPEYRDRDINLQDPVDGRDDGSDHESDSEDSSVNDSGVDDHNHVDAEDSDVENESTDVKESGGDDEGADSTADNDRDLNARQANRQFNGRFDGHFDNQIRRRFGRRSPEYESCEECYDHEQMVRDGIRSMMSLMKVNRQIHGEVQEAFYGKAVVDFRASADQHGYSFSGIQGLGRTTEAYTTLKDQNTFLEDNLRNFRSITLELRIDEQMLIDHNGLVLSQCIREYWRMLDNLRLLVNACNASHSLRKVEICCRVNEGYSDHRRKTANLQCALLPFEKLRPEIDLRVHFHVTGRNEDGELDDRDLQAHETNFPLHAWTVYVSLLEAHRTLQSSEWLINEWIRLRAWLQGTVPSLARPRRYSLAVDDSLTLQYADVPWKLQAPLDAIVSAAWIAHSAGNRPAFQAAKAKLKTWWNELCTWRTTTMMDGLPVEVEREALAKNVERRRGGFDDDY